MDALAYALTLSTICAASFSELMASRGMLPGPLKFLPEMLSLPTVLLVFVGGTWQRFRGVNGKYWLVFLALALVILCGIIANGVAPGPIVSGLRFYLRAIPFFFLPAIAPVRDWQMRHYLKLCFAVALLQVPLAIVQRNGIMSSGHYTNADVVYGSMMQSGILSLFLICVLCLLGAGVLRGMVSWIKFAIAFVILMIPMSINETKVTVIALPIGLLSTFILGAPRGRRLRMTALTVAVLVVGASIFIPVFNYYQAKSDIPYKITDFFENKDELAGYMNNEAGVGSAKEPGRIDSLTVPLDYLSHDPIKLLLGVGIGNASRSNINQSFVGAYFDILGRYGLQSSAALFLIEIGVIGVVLILLMHVMIFRDTLRVARHDSDVTGALALGFVSATIVLALGFFYGVIHVSPPLAYLYWLFAGVIATRAQHLRSPQWQKEPAAVVRAVSAGGKQPKPGKQPAFPAAEHAGK
jgi:hypothetical protein